MGGNLAVSVPIAGDLGVVGCTVPRLWTPPLRDLTPETSFGFEVIDFARDVLGAPLDPWEEWLVIHAGELLADGRPRFRQVLVEVARQNGKTHVAVVLTLWWQFRVGVPMVLGTSTKVDYAKESWAKSVAMAEAAPQLADLRPPGRWTRDANGEQESWTLPVVDPETGEQLRPVSRYKIAASNRFGGRSLTVYRLILDELREHHDYSAWGAAVPAMNAVWDAQVWALTNAGDDKSVVLNEMHDACELFIETGDGDYRVGMFSWSSEDDADPLDVHALAQANPNLGRRIDPEVLLADAATAVRKGGDALSTFKTEYMCIRVKKLNPAIDAGAWRKGLEVGTLEGLRRRVVVCLDVAPDQLHATLVAAAVMSDDRVRVEVLRAWDGPECTKDLRRELPGLLAKVKPRALGWFPSGPAASVAADLNKRKRPGWPPAGCKVEEIRGEVAAVCMGLKELVTAGQVVHSDDPLLTAHVTGAERLKRGDVWVFSRKGDGHCDAAYAAAGAVHLARTLPPPVGKPRLIIAS